MLQIVLPPFPLLILTLPFNDRPWLLLPLFRDFSSTVLSSLAISLLLDIKRRNLMLCKSDRFPSGLSTDNHTARSAHTRTQVVHLSLSLPRPYQRQFQCPLLRSFFFGRSYPPHWPSSSNQLQSSHFLVPASRAVYCR